MEEEKAAAYYDELSRKGEGAAKFKQGLGFSATSNSNDAVPSQGSALPSAASSFLSNFVRASSPSKNAELEKQAQLQSIQNKLKKKPREEDKTVSSSRVSKDRDSRDRHSHRRNRSRSRERHSKHRSRSKDRGRDRHSRRRSRSRSRSRDDYSPKRRYRSRSTSRDRGRERKRSSSGSDEERDRRKKRSVDRRSEKRHKVGKGRNSVADYATVIEGYDKMAPAERVKAKMKLQLSETAERDETKGGMGSGWERFDFDKDAPLDDEEIEAAEDDAAIVKRIGQTFRFSSMETGMMKQKKRESKLVPLKVPR
ncbi:PREDICTED: serine/threonine-protein kinase fray2 isoform X2 [Ipomoea nil]|uniref:serine/threonine-protein kinase fray2 isoform X2 n=1 Tax=Ipomoea nil TaxID=35883 RepID=UPI0009014779|nr:PREDICTED: serine/threonine-protein kinase fray2 isoform X2 [Ipomoea nil]